MKTKLITFLSLVAISNANASQTKCSASTSCLPQNMQISVYGKNMGPKQQDYDSVRNSIGGLVADLQLKRFVLQATGTEGGFTACLVPNGDHGYSTMMQKMTAIEVDRNETMYNIKFVDDCAN